MDKISKLETPFGIVEILFDDVFVQFNCQDIGPNSRLFPDVNGAFRIFVDVELDGEEHRLKMKIRNCDVRGDVENGELFESLAFYSGVGKLTLGCYASFGDCDEFGLDYDGSLCSDGIEIYISASTRTSTFKFGVCWLDECTDENEVQTWFGADPSIRLG